MQITADIITGHSVKSSTNGFSATRVFKVEDIGGQPDARMYLALLGSGIPRVGDPHPSIPGIKVLDVDASPEEDSNNKAVITVSYGVEDNKTDPASEAAGITSIEVDATTISEETQQDIDGAFMVNKYTGYQGFGAIVQACMPVRVTVYRPQLTVRIRKSQSSLPKALIQQFLGTVNATPWSGYPAGTWLCTALNASFSNGKWELTYGFLYREEGWRVVDLIQINGSIPGDVAEGNGIARFKVYKEVPWSSIGVSW